MQTLKHYINTLIARTDQYSHVRLEGREEKKYHPYDYYKTDKRRINGDHVIIISHKDDNKRAMENRSGFAHEVIYMHPSMAITFQYKGMDTPLIQFSYAAPGKTKEIVYSMPFDIQSFREVMKLKLKSDSRNKELIISLKEAFIDGELDSSIGEQIKIQKQQFDTESEAFVTYIDSEIDTVKSLVNTYLDACKTRDTLLADVDEEAKQTPEYKQVQQLKAELDEARTKLINKRTEIAQARPELAKSENLINSLQKEDSGLGFKVFDAYERITSKAIEESGLTRSARMSKINGLRTKLLDIFNASSLYFPYRWRMALDQIEKKIRK